MQSIRLTTGQSRTIPVAAFDANGNVTAPPTIPVTYIDVSDDGSTPEFKNVITLALTSGNTDGTSIDITAGTSIGRQRVRATSGSLTADLMVEITGPAASIVFLA